VLQRKTAASRTAKIRLIFIQYTSLVRIASSVNQRSGPSVSSLTISLLLGNLLHIPCSPDGESVVAHEKPLFSVSISS
jgi:hypothetical protein